MYSEGIESIHISVHILTMIGLDAANHRALYLQLKPQISCDSTSQTPVRTGWIGKSRKSFGEKAFCPYNSPQQTSFEHSENNNKSLIWYMRCRWHIQAARNPICFQSFDNSQTRVPNPCSIPMIYLKHLKAIFHMIHQKINKALFYSCFNVSSKMKHE